MPGKVADASVLAAMFFREPRSEEARALVGSDILFEPPLLPYELVSVARKKIDNSPGLASEVTEALETALSLAYEWVNVDIVAVLRLADETGLTTYDASYLHVASVLDLPLVTFDKRLARAASNRV